MANILNQYADKINGSFSFFDRMIITGHLRSFFSSMMYFLSEENVLLKDYGAYVQGVTDSIKKHVLDYTNGQQRPLIYLKSPKISNQSCWRGAHLHPVNGGTVQCFFGHIQPSNPQVGDQMHKAKMPALLFLLPGSCLRFYVRKTADMVSVYHNRLH